MPAPDSVARLVKRFADNREDYISGSYNETRLRREFIDPLFKALGWDIDNEQGYAESYKEVIHEDAIRIGGVHKAPDYAFRIGGQRKFFVEAKRPSVDIRMDAAPAYQLRRYAWSAKLPVSVLTDFAEFAIYDTRVRPKAGDKASTARILYITCDEYLSRWDEIESLFSREAVLRGQFDKFADAKTRKGSAAVDDAFLQDIEGWRDELARNIAIRNSTIANRDLNHAVQITIDRIIFLRICEDRGVEEYGQLLALLNGNQTYARMVELFAQADAKYNSGLFHFRKEKGRADAPDGFTPSLAIDDKPLKEIVRGLYPPDSPYEFSVIPAEILGHVYERFLGKVIRLTAGHRAVVEEKPEVRHAKGVYYTPTFIVDEIVSEIVGKALDGKTPKQVAEYRVVDPACGSGSFLLGAFEYLLAWHTKWYSENRPEEWARAKVPVVVQRGGGDYVLTTAERKRILLTHIYGVDIDAQAVEVTKLSLLLKVLEGETAETLQTQFGIFRERALPDLEQNIKWGNSLIDSRFYEQQQLGILDDDIAYRVNAFEWAKQFPQVFAKKNPGFDAVIGNPPYIRIQALSEWAPEEVAFFKSTFTTAAKGNYDLYVVFVERALALLSSRGRLGFILPHKFFNAKYGEPLRKLLGEGRHVGKVVHFGDAQVFDGPTTYTALLFLSKARNDQVEVVRVADLGAWRLGARPVADQTPAGTLGAGDWHFSAGRGSELLERLAVGRPTLAEQTTRIFQGLKTGGDSVYVVEELRRKGNKVLVASRSTEAEYWIEGALLHPLIKGGDSRRFVLSRTKRLILFPYETTDDGAKLIGESKFRAEWPDAWRYLNDNKLTLSERESGKWAGKGWYGYTRNQALDVICLPKMFTPDIAAHAAFSADPVGDAFFSGGAAGGYGLLPTKVADTPYLLGVLNSRLLEWIIRQTSTVMRGGYYSYEARYIRSLPIAAPKAADKAGRARRERVEELAGQLVETLGRVPEAGPAKAVLERRAESLFGTLNETVYELYGLSDREIAIVESAFAQPTVVE